MTNTIMTTPNLTKPHEFIKSAVYTDCICGLPEVSPLHKPMQKSENLGKPMQPHTTELTAEQKNKIRSWYQGYSKNEKLLVLHTQKGMISFIEELLDA